MKACPYCASQIQDAAIKCRYCGMMLTPEALAKVPPSAPSPTRSAQHPGATVPDEVLSLVPARPQSIPALSESSDPTVQAGPTGGESGSSVAGSASSGWSEFSQTCPSCGARNTLEQFLTGNCVRCGSRIGGGKVEKRAFSVNVEREREGRVSVLAEQNGIVQHHDSQAASSRLSAAALATNSDARIGVLATVAGIAIVVFICAFVALCVNISGDKTCEDAVRGNIRAHLLSGDDSPQKAYSIVSGAMLFMCKEDKWSQKKIQCYVDAKSIAAASECGDLQ